jgi:hypothetical protein
VPLEELGKLKKNPPLWSVVRVLGYRYRGPGFDSRIQATEFVVCNDEFKGCRRKWLWPDRGITPVYSWKYCVNARESSVRPLC